MIIDKAVSSLSHKLVERYPRELPSYAITRYGIKFLVSNIIPITLLLILGAILDILPIVSLSIASFSILRMVSGGYHAKYPEACLVISTVLIMGIAIYNEYLSPYMILCNVLSLVLVAIYAPSNIENQTKIKKKYFGHLKVISVLLVSTNFILQNTVIAASFLVQSILLIRLKGGVKK
ncbi:accessory gene regulator B family protein [Paenibacillus illinoisensis]|uniref:Accessory gene regulator B n=1 Tax=Paenibacillus illinoisensis TaxID=59845 RepID=A0A2W0C8F2_9BACL|nr:accessory gene regulator B family protein [Paenibacillus illinoisensis]PYY28284.1 Uncharacterized protein PIL02S_03435 [Paenibacillus illinoisensis]